jgi:hypothetical protein
VAIQHHLYTFFPFDYAALHMMSAPPLSFQGTCFSCISGKNFIRKHCMVLGKGMAKRHHLSREKEAGQSERQHAQLI